LRTQETFHEGRPACFRISLVENEGVLGLRAAWANVELDTWRTEHHIVSKVRCDNIPGIPRNPQIHMAHSMLSHELEHGVINIGSRSAAAVSSCGITLRTYAHVMLGSLLPSHVATTLTEVPVERSSEAFTCRRLCRRILDTPARAVLPAGSADCALLCRAAALVSMERDASASDLVS